MYNVPSTHPWNIWQRFNSIIVLVAKNVILINKTYLLVLYLIDNYVMALLYSAFHLISLLPLILFFLEELGR